MNLFTNKDKIAHVKLSQIITNAKQPRSIFDDDKIKELAASINEHGVLQPIIVRQINNNYVIVAGERRYRACLTLNLDTIPAIIKEFDEVEASSVALIENIQRENLTAIEEAKAFKSLMKLNNLRQEDLANKLGKAQSTIANKIRLLNLPEEIQDEILNKTITERHARALLLLKDKDIQLKVLKKITENHWTVKETEKYIDKLLNKTIPNKSKVISKIPKDIRIALNTLHHAVSMVEKMGIDLQTNEEEDEKYYIYKVKIAKSK